MSQTEEEQTLDFFFEQQLSGFRNMDTEAPFLLQICSYTTNPEDEISTCMAKKICNTL